MIGRIPILDVRPAVGCGRWPAKAVPGETFEVSATVFREGHEAAKANAVLSDPEGRVAASPLMRELAPGLDRWGADVTPTREGRWTFHIEAWGDPVAHWRHDAGIKIPAGQDVELMCEEGALLLERAAAGVPNASREVLSRVGEALRDRALDPEARLAAALAPEVTDILEAHPLRELVTASEFYPVEVDRPRALFGSWYEMFPRSEGATLDPPRSGTFRSAAKRLPAIADMGFDVVYLPPIHPIGRSFRKGPNNTLQPGSDAPGSPWAIGSELGGHDAVHPDLGTLDDFDAFVAHARDLGMEVALDLALHCSPDHPWVREHPEWFTTRADGSIAYAENPPKKYQDIYPINFDNDPEGIYAEVLRLVRHWAAHGVRIFRVDNPHTKPLPFWERLLAEVRSTDPDVLFLAEAFTRPAMMHTLAKIGFHQSYTYFTWRTTKEELEDYLRELSGPAAAYMRPNFFVNTPDILHAYLQHGGPPAFKIRAVLASMLCPSWGMYSGYELFEREAVRPGSEEYLDSEKYQYRPRNWETAEREGRTLTTYIAQLNRLRRAHPALQRLRNLRFHHVDQPEIICFSKRLPASHGRPGAGQSESGVAAEAGPRGTERPGWATGVAEGVGDAVLVVVNLDPHTPREATVWLDMPELGLDWNDQVDVYDELSGQSHRWGEANYVRLDPDTEPAHIFRIASDVLAP